MSTTPHGPDWRAGSAPRGRGVGLGAIILLATAVAAAGIGLLLLVQPPRAASVLVVTLSGTGTDSPVSFAAPDADAFAAGLDRRPLPADPTRDQLRAALADLKNAPAGRPLVLVLNGAVELSDSGELLLARGTPADHPRNRVPLTEVLAAVRSAPASGSLVVLNCVGEADWVPAAVAAADAVPDGKRRVLFPHAVGEVANASEVRGHTVFAHYYATGMGGAADGWGGGAKDGRITTNELAAFVRARVSRWAERCRTRPQSPWLMGTGDLPLGQATGVADTEPAAWEYPAEFREAWAVRDGWLADGRADAAPAEFDTLERALLKMDRDWLAGKPAAAARGEFDATAAKLKATEITLPAVLQLKSMADVAAVDALTRFLIRTEGVTPPPAEKPPASTADVILAAAALDPPPPLLRLVRLAKLLIETEPEPVGVPSLLLRRVATTDDPISAERFARLLRAAIPFEDLTRRTDLYPWAGEVIDAAHADFVSATAAVFHAGYASGADADAALTTLEDAVRGLAFAGGGLKAATAELRRGERLLAAGTTDSRLTAAVAKLRAALTPKALPLRPLTEAAAGWAAVQSEVEAARKPLEPDATEWKRLTRTTEGPSAGSKELEVAERALAVAGPTAADRAALWAARLALSARLQAEVWQADRRDDPPATVDPRDVPPTRYDRPTSVVRGAAPTNPDPTGRTQMLRWQAERFAYLARNPADLPALAAEPSFFTRAADQCGRAVTDVPARPSLEFDFPPTTLALTADKRTVPVPFSVRLVGGAKNEPARVGVLTPSAEWVAPAPAADIELSPVKAVPLSQSAALGTAPDQYPMAKGLLVRGEVTGRVFFRRVSIDTSSVSNRLKLLAKIDGVEEEAKELRVRPNGQPLPVALMLSNPSASPQSVLVRLADPARETAPIALLPKQSALLVFPPPPPPATPSPNPAPVPAPEFTSLPGTLRLEVLDGKTREVRQVFVLPVRTTEPAELLTVREVKLKGSDLSATVGERETLRGGPMPLALAFPPDRNPGLTVPDAKLSGTLEPGAAPLTLYAKNLKRQAGAPLVATITADGMERAFTFTGEPAGAGDTVRLEPFTAPRVKVRVAEFASPFDPLPVPAETDNAPPGATLDVRIGLESGGEFKPDFVHPPTPAKARTLEAKFDAKAGLILRATVRDPEPKLNLDRLVGKRTVRVRLLDVNGTEIARDSATVTFDDSDPRNVRLLDLPPKVRADQPLKVRAACDLPVSGIKEVKFFLGKPVDNKPPPNAVFLPGKPAEGGKEWTGSIPLDGGKTPVDVSVQFISKAGRSGFATQTVERLDAAEADKKEPGSIRGLVTEGETKQPGLVLQLLEGGKEKAKATTDENGKFAFADVAPGKYELYVGKPTTGREKRLPVEVKAGEEKEVAVGLVLK